MSEAQVNFIKQQDALELAHSGEVNMARIAVHYCAY